MLAILRRRSNRTNMQAKPVKKSLKPSRKPSKNTTETQG